MGVLVGSGDPKFLDIQSQHAAIKALKNMRNRQIGSSSHLFGNKIKHVPKHQPALSLPYDLGDNHPLSSYDCPGIIRVSHLCRSGRFEGSYFPAAQLGWKQLRNTLEMEII